MSEKLKYFSYYSVPLQVISKTTNISLFWMLSEFILTCVSHIGGGRGTPMKPGEGAPIQQNQNIAAKCKSQEQPPFLHACTERSASLCHHVRLTSRVHYIMRFDSLNV